MCVQTLVINVHLSPQDDDENDDDLSVLAKSLKGNSPLEGAMWSFLINRQKLCLHSVLLTKMHCRCFKSSIVYIHEFPEHSCISWCVTVTCRSVGKCDTIGKTVYHSCGWGACILIGVHKVNKRTTEKQLHSATRGRRNYNNYCK